MSPHYISLIFAYATGMGIWFLLNYFFPSLWKPEERIYFNKPYLEFAFSIIAVFAILGIGQLYIRSLLIPNDGNILVDALNQFIIFSPVFVLILIRKQSLATLWLPKSRVVIRLLAGLLIALFSVVTYWLTRSGANGLGNILINIYHYQNISHLVQVFMEDVTIALIFVRLSAWIGNKWSILLVAVLFAAGHIPSLVTNGTTFIELGSLIIDALLGVLVLTAVSKSKDIWWFFMVHFAIDMTQFYGN
jgi:hypothetical protein